jgi:pseudaminic acid synthase
MPDHITINGRAIGPGKPAYIIAEMSANHGQNFDQAVALLRAAKEAGADAIKLQTYTPDTLTIDCNSEHFRIEGSLWHGQTLYRLYEQAQTPWEWQPRLKELADELAIDCFSSPFDSSAVTFLEAMNVPAYKIASFEVVDIPLIEKVASLNKPTIISTGMASLSEIEEAVNAFRRAGGAELALLKCTSAYPAPPAEMNLRTISHLSQAFGVPVGVSDHTLGVAVPAAAVALGACIIEKHFTLSRQMPGPDAAFSLEPNEFKLLVDTVRAAEQALGTVSYSITADEEVSRVFRRSLFVTKDIEQGEELTLENVRSIRPGYGMPPKYLADVLGRRARARIPRGTPLRWDLLS